MTIPASLSDLIAETKGIAKRAAAMVADNNARRGLWDQPLWNEYLHATRPDVVLKLLDALQASQPAQQPATVMTREHLTAEKQIVREWLKTLPENPDKAAVFECWTLTINELAHLYALDRSQPCGAAGDVTREQLVDVLRRNIHENNPCYTRNGIDITSIYSAADTILALLRSQPAAQPGNGDT